MKKTIQVIIPQKKTHVGKGVDVINFPKIIATKIAVNRLINIFAQFSRCLLSKFMNKKYYKILTNTTTL